MSAKLSDILTAKDSTQIALDDMRYQVRELVNRDTRFNSEHGKDVVNSAWIDSILHDGDKFCAIVSQDGKLFEVGFTVEGGKVKELGDEAKEVRRKTSLVAASEPFKFNGQPVSDDAGEVVKCVRIQTPETANESELVACKDSGIPISTEKKWEFEKPTKFMWAPGGTSCITCSSMGRSMRIWVVGDKAGAAQVQDMFEKITAKSPRRAPFGCIEHHEEERAFTPKGFEWSETPEPGIYCSAVPTKLGENNVNGKLHTSFSPCFLHDGRRATAICSECGEGVAKCECNGTLEFPEGVRGSQSNPAHIIGVSEKSVGSLTNWPAFKDILPLTAKEPAKQAEPAKKSGSKDAEPEKAKAPEKSALELLFAACPPLNRRDESLPKVIGHINFASNGANGKPASR